MTQECGVENLSPKMHTQQYTVMHIYKHKTEDETYLSVELLNMQIKLR